MGRLNILRIDNGIRLDDLPIKGVRSYNISQEENADTAELTLKMDVSILIENNCVGNRKGG